MTAKIHETDQILALEPNHTGGAACQSCLAPSDRAIVSGYKSGPGTNTQSLRLCNVCLSRLRELITAYEHAEPERRAPAVCLSCQHAQSAHYRTPQAAGCGVKGCDCSGLVSAAVPK